MNKKILLRMGLALEKELAADADRIQEKLDRAKAAIFRYQQVELEDEVERDLGKLREKQKRLDIIANTLKK